MHCFTSAVPAQTFGRYCGLFCQVIRSAGDEPRYRYECNDLPNKWKKFGKALIFELISLNHYSLLPAALRWMCSVCQRNVCKIMAFF